MIIMTWRWYLGWRERGRESQHQERGRWLPRTEVVISDLRIGRGALHISATG
jgi:hypothetical protein